MSAAPPGLQPERTALAWRRMSLALIGLSLASVKVTWHSFGTWAFAIAAVGVSLGMWLTVHEARRYARHSATLDTGNGVGEGVAPLLTAALTVGIAIVAVVSVLTGR